jgi:methylmalonyl-CoA/ethylmalonyl-CoA epimerase
MNVPDAEILKALSFGEVNQLGFVVENLEDALKNFRDKLGIKNWYRPVSSEKSDGSTLYRGNRIPMEWDFVMGYLGSVQFELVCNSGENNIYSEHLEERGEGLHHICFFVSDMENKLASYKQLGIEPIQSGTLVSKGGAITKYAYLDSRLMNGLIIEMTETRLFGIPIKMTPFMMKVGHMKGDLEKVQF